MKFFVLFGSAAAAPASLSLHLLRDHSQAICNDGSPGGFYFRKAIQKQQSKMWLVYLPPHHWCSDEASCADRYATDIDMMSSRNWKETIVADGIFAEGPLANANLVQVGYCSSDLYLGDVPASDATWGWHFRGEQIIRGVFGTLPSLGLDADHTVVLGGASAGARGATVWLDHLKELVPSGVRRFGFLDTPHPFHHFKAFPPTGPTPDYTAENTQEIVEMLKPNIDKFLIPEACPKASEHWKCFYAEFRLLHVKEDFALVAPRFGHEIESDLGVASVDNLSQEQLQYAEAWGKDVLRVTSLLASTAGRRVLYSPSCFQPGVNSGLPAFYQGGQGVENVTQQQALEKLLSSNDPESFTYADECSGFNCGPKCDPLSVEILV